MCRIFPGTFFVVFYFCQTPFFLYIKLNHIVSQFTLLANTKKGSKPDFHGAMGGEQAKELYQRFVSKVGEGYHPEKVKDGVFQAMMEVALVNDGPVSSINLALDVADKI